MLEEHAKNPLNLRNISRSQILCLKWAKFARKLLAKYDGWGMLKIKKSGTLVSWKKLLLKAAQLKRINLTSTKAMIIRLK
jgi:hypothetical protein